mmetsp:Transcript_101259/g.286971  ORF Transcript_101259/g.286971 Transcript_101259/m.286971 type:complete len:139 (-) Transcript_101259:112-528(-)
MCRQFSPGMPHSATLSGPCSCPSWTSDWMVQCPGRAFSGGPVWSHCRVQQQQLQQHQQQQQQRQSPPSQLSPAQHLLPTRPNPPHYSPLHTLHTLHTLPHRLQLLQPRRLGLWLHRLPMRRTLQPPLQLTDSLRQLLG